MKTLQELYNETKSNCKVVITLKNKPIFTGVMGDITMSGNFLDCIIVEKSFMRNGELIIRVS